MAIMTRNDEDFLSEDYQKYKKNMLDVIKKKYGLTDEEAEEYYNIDPQYAQAALLCAAIENGPQSSVPDTVNLTVSPQVAQFLKLS